MKGKMVVVGNASVDSIVTEFGILHPRLIGGNAFHVSMSASLFTNNVAIVSVIPRNFPREAFDIFLKRGVDLSAVKVIDVDVTGEELFIYDHVGDRKDNIFRNSGEADEPRQLNPEEIRTLETSPHQEDLYTFNDFRTSYRASRDQIPRDWEIVALHLAPTALQTHMEFMSMNIPIITLDPGAYLKNMELEQIVQLIRNISVFIPSKKEMGWIFPDLSPLDAVRTLARMTKTSIICKNGKKGSYVYSHQDAAIYELGTYPAIVKDYTGAGDFFCGAVTSQLAQGTSLLESAKIATVTSAKAIEHMSVITRATLEKDAIIAGAHEVPCKKLENM